MKKLLSIFCVLVLTTALLCGCAATPAPSESTADATTVVTTATTTAATTEATAAPTTEATTAATTTTEATTTVATAAPTTAPVTRPTFDPSIPIAVWPALDEGRRHDGSCYFTFEGFEYKARFGQAGILRYIGSETDVTIPDEVQYVYLDKLYTAKPKVSLSAFYNTAAKTVRWQPEAVYYLSGDMRTADLVLPSHIYLPKNINLSAEQFLRGDSAMSDKNVFWYNIIGTPSFGALTEPLHLYLIKGAPLTELLYDERAYFPYGWELDFSEEGTYCFYTQKDGKDDQPVYFHVAESFE